MDSILIVEGDAPIRNHLTFLLTQAGYLCRQAEDICRARHLLTEHPFDLILLDLDLPESLGTELIRLCKTRYSEMAIVLASQYPHSPETNEALTLGAYGYLLKPYNQDLILLTVKNALRLHKLELREQFSHRILEREIATKTRHLDEQLHFLQTLLDAIPVPIFYKDTDCVYLGCNRAFEDVFALKRASVIGKTTFDIHPPELAKVLHKKDEVLLQKGGKQVYERKKTSANGKKKTALIHKATFNNIKGEVAGFVGVGIDITALKQSEASLRQSEKKIRTIMNNLHIGILMIDMQLRIHQVNLQVEHWFSKEMTTRKHYGLLDLFTGESEELNQERITEVFHKGVSREFMAQGTQPATDHVFRLVITPIVQEHKECTMAVVLCEDVTERLFLERELQQTQKLEAIGQLAAGVAHEINTPVQYVGDNLRFLSESFKDIVELTKLLDNLFKEENDTTIEQSLIKARALYQEADICFLLEEIPHTIEQSLDGINKVATIVRAMREFSHPGTEGKVLVDINHTLENTLIVSRNEWKYVADTQTDFPENLPFLRCNPVEINQVFLNLIVNAAHAIGEATQEGKKGKGTISLSTREEQGFLVIRIADTGCGIPKKIADKIFEPFFTTKKVGVGTGQGLAIARNVIVDKHQGTLRFTSEPNQGTTFVISLPIT